MSRRWCVGELRERCHNNPQSIHALAEGGMEGFEGEDWEGEWARQARGAGLGTGVGFVCHGGSARAHCETRGPAAHGCTRPPQRDWHWHGQEIDGLQICRQALLALHWRAATRCPQTANVWGCRCPSPTVSHSVHPNERRTQPVSPRRSTLACGLVSASSSSATQPPRVATRVSNNRRHAVIHNTLECPAGSCVAGAAHPPGNDDQISRPTSRSCPPKTEPTELLWRRQRTCHDLQNRGHQNIRLVTSKPATSKSATSENMATTKTRHIVSSQFTTQTVKPHNFTSNILRHFLIARLKT